MRIRPIILSGGSGTRLWPVSRRLFPKQYAPLIGRESLFTKALQLTGDRSLFEPPMIVGNIEHKFLILDAIESLGIRDAKIILEQQGQNTAAAIIVAAQAEEDDDVLHLVLPSDHIIEDHDKFIDTIRLAAPASAAGNIVLFGMSPVYPETGYGYIIPAENLAWKNIFRVASFHEKPDVSTAKQLLAKNALWNSGIFFHQSGFLKKEAKTLAPEHFEKCLAALNQSQIEKYGLVLASEPYSQLRPEPFDRLILERTSSGAVIPTSIGWSDAGSWQTIWQMAKKDENGNSLLGPVVTHDVKNMHIRSDGPIVAVVGMEGVTVIATRDAILVTPHTRAQDVKTVVAAIDHENPSVTLNHSRVARPWGSYEGLAQGKNYQVKHIIVQPGSSLSMQKHHHRAEHWIVVGGTAKVESDGVEKLVFPNESVYIPRGTFHRLSNPGKIPLDLIEVQSGDYLGEDDIIRVSDNYGRAS
jgi:mannose-1-phosphate guanylyltransferase / mannose-6-phosphate isomerase